MLFSCEEVKEDGRTSRCYCSTCDGDAASCILLSVYMGYFIMVMNVEPSFHDAHLPPANMINQGNKLCH